MTKIEYLDPEIANEGLSADDMPEIEEPHINDYATLKKHKHYKRYFKPYVFQPFPAFIYHKTDGEKLVGDAKTAAQYGVSYNKEDSHWVCEGDWKVKPVVARKASPTDTGKTLVNATAQQAAMGTNELMAQILQQLVKGQGSVAPALATAIGEDKEYQDYLAFKRMQAGEAPKAILDADLPPVDEKALLIEAAESRDIKIDKRWSVDRIKTELDKVA